MAIAAGMLALSMGVPATASDSISVTVSANIVGVCKFFNGPYTITIANSGSDINPSIATTATGSADIEYRCSNGTAPTFTVPASVTLNGPSAASMDATINYIPGGAGTGMGSGQGKTLQVVGTIVQANYENKPTGSYTNSITVDVSP